MDIQLLFVIFLSALLGGLIGFDRQKKHKPAGLRTHILVCMGAALFTKIAIISFPLNPVPVIANIIVGIGFLGAGTIWKIQKHVQGLTTAASLWITAGVAITVALGFYIEALIITVVVFLVLEFAEIDNHV